MDTPFWLDEPTSPVEADSQGPVDVAIIGAGIAGCACALELARGGLRVRVHDARGIAEGASGRNGGFALRGGAARTGATPRVQLIPASQPRPCPVRTSLGV